MKTDHRATLLLLLASLTACGSVASGGDGGVDGHAAAPDARHDTLLDASVHDSGRDARAAAQDGTASDRFVPDVVFVDDGPERPVDATEGGSDAARDTGIEAGREAGNDCTMTGAARGTMTTLAAPPGSAPIADYSIDCNGLFFTTTDGNLYSCPPSGCVGAPEDIGAAIPPRTVDGGTPSQDYMVKLGGDGLVYARVDSVVRPGDAGAFKLAQLVDVYTLARSGSGVKLIAEFAESDGCSTATAGNLEVYGQDIYFVVTCDHFAETGSTTFFVEALPYDGGLAALDSVGVSYAGGSPDSPPAPRGPGAVGGVVYYKALNTVVPPYQYTVTADPIAAAPDTWLAGVAGVKDITASTAFVAWSGVLLGDGGSVLLDGGRGLADAGGASVVYVCDGGLSCAAPVPLTGVAAAAVTAMYGSGTTLFYTDTTNDLYECDQPVAGSCTPELVASSVPAFGGLTTDAYNVYVLTQAGDVVRIAR